MPCTQYLKNQKFRSSNRLNWLKDLETIPINCFEAHVPTPRYGQYLKHGHNRQWQPWTAVSSLLGLMVERMRKVLAIPRSWYVCFKVVNLYFLNLFGHVVQFFWSHLHTHTVGELFLQFPTNSYHLFTVELAPKEVLALASVVKGFCQAG